MYLLQRDGIAHWLKRRRRLMDVDYTDQVDATLSGIHGIRRLAVDPVEGTAKRLVAGEIGAIYTGRMEYGPRALGGRSILANPSRRKTHDLLCRIDKSQLAISEPKRLRDKSPSKICCITAVSSLWAQTVRSPPSAQPRAIGLKVSDEFTVPLCRGHHRQLHQAGNEVAWWERLQINALEIAN